MSSKIIIIATAVLLIVSFSVLFVIEAKNHSYDYNKAWSVVYFENPRDLPEAAASLQAGASLDFAIENHEGSKSEYGYKVFVGDEKVIDESVEIAAGATQKISPVIPSERLAGNKILIDVNCKDTEYKIYKNLEK
jgi:hypothetical protein